MVGKSWWAYGLCFKVALNFKPVLALNPKLSPRRQKLLSLVFAATPETGNQSGEGLEDVLGLDEGLGFRGLSLLGFCQGCIM